MNKKTDDSKVRSELIALGSAGAGKEAASCSLTTSPRFLSGTH
jgi:hypothetical protein